MKTKSVIAKSMMVAVLGLTLLSPKAQATATDQVAIQLGAIQLGITISNNSTQEQLAQALAQGRAVLRATARSGGIGVQGFPIPASSVQSEALRAQLLDATVAALSSPITATISGSVTLTNNRTSTVRGTLNPRRVTASAIFDLATKRIPNFSPGLITDAIGATVATTAPSVYVFNYRDERAMLTDLNKTAGIAMKNGLKAYARGTVNWAGVPTTGVGNGTFLPNFSTRPIPTRTTAGVPQAPDLAGLANAAGAVAGAAASALEANFSALSSASVQVSAMTNLASALVKGAAAFQRTSTSRGTTSAPLTPLVGGSVAGAGFGAVAMLADPAANRFDAAANSILSGIVSGGVKGSSANAYAFAWGVASGFTAAYYEGNLSPENFTDFRLANAAIIEQAFLAVKVKPSGKFDSGSGSSTITLLSVIQQAMDAANLAFINQNYSTLAGALGLQLPGVPTPVTDTVGL